MNPTTLAEHRREGRLLRIFLGESDRTRGQPTYEAVVAAARRHGLAGATVLRGHTGFGANSVIHRGSPWRISSDLPMVIEIVDDPERIAAFLPALDALLEGGGLVTLERVWVLRYRSSEP